MKITEITPDYINHLQSVSNEMVAESSRIVAAGQRGELALNTAVKDADRSLLTDVDRYSEEAAKAVWHRHTNHPILGEETGVSSVRDSDERILGMNDPIDGTRPFVNGAHTSTDMAGAYDLRDKRFLASSVAHPTSGTLVEASNGRTHVSRLYLPEDGGFELIGRRESETWDGPLRESTVLIDNFAPFHRKGPDGSKKVITDPARLLRFQGKLLEEGAVPQGYGSNGYHQMLLARGGEKLAGAVMLAQGGPWDALGIPAVENAGGAAHAFSVLENGRVTEIDPHDSFNWDILVLGSTAINAAKLAGVIEQTYNK
jgi:fructose-1,6-bisphosphatase/inositol monophosphatase family enzyme